ncbi:E-selectin-like [Pagrus major]|uniref:E-selectin-like n=1 Tax=Pagrus major TaxID=143350 RepID=UPI003CC85CDA
MLPRFEPLSVESSPGSRVDARKKLRIARLQLEKQERREEREFQLQRKLELKRLEMEAETAIKMQKATVYSPVGATLEKLQAKRKLISGERATFKRHQLNYSTIEKETLAMLLALQHFEVYVSSIPSTVGPLVFLAQMRDHYQRLMRSSFAETALGWTYYYTNETMNWTQAREWCRKHHTDMVVIQSQEENDYVVSKLPNRTKTPYYWIGITRNHKNETWTWIGNNSTWIGEDSWAKNEPNNNYSTEFCVEIYVNSGAGRGKWNDEKCSSKKFPVCYKAQCNATSCDRGRCQEIPENITCVCEPGFKGDRCQTGEEKVLCD